MSKFSKLIYFYHFTEMVIGKSYVGDWFLIYLMGQNIDSVIFKDVIHELAKKLGYRSRDIGETWLSDGEAHRSSSHMNGGGSHMNGGVH